MAKEQLEQPADPSRDNLTTGLSRAYPSGVGFWLWQNQSKTGEWLESVYEVDENIWKQVKHIFFKGMSRSDIKDTAAGGKVTLKFNLKPGMNFVIVTPPGKGAKEFR